MCGSEELIHDARQVDLEDVIMTNEVPGSVSGQEPVGVFVRLPLSEEQESTFCDKVGDDDINEAILAIGTPVRGGKLPTAIFRVREHSEDNSNVWSYHKAPPSDQDASENELEVERLLTHEQSLAKLAEKDAEIARDSERLDWLDRACVHTYEPKQYLEGIGCGVCRVSHRPNEGHNLREAIDAAREVG